jgi:chromosome segregation ATPase
MKHLVIFAGLVVLLTVSINSCGGGGVSDEFTKEINDFETAWNNAETSYTAIIDTVNAAKQKWTGCTAELVLPDSVKEDLNASRIKELDSIANVGKEQGAIYDQLTADMNAYKTTLDAQGKAFADWKAKVMKGEIDIETAKKDLKEYKAKIEEITNKSNEANNRLAEVRIACEGNCSSFEEKLKAPLEEEKDEKENKKSK